MERPPTARISIAPNEGAPGMPKSGQATPESGLPSDAPFFGLVGPRQLAKLRGLIARAASSTATVLITGESGTGKELVARAIHACGSRAPLPFIPVNCGGIPETLLESELFGHTRGAFTGATETRPGLFQAAEGGTLLLDEIAETPASMQVKLLRVLQDREVRMIGSRAAVVIDARIIAATNRDLGRDAEAGLFRRDLFYRINIIPILLPPLRERGAEDILGLTAFFLLKYLAQAGKPPMAFSAQALEALVGHSWPGNIRELENLVQRQVWMHDGATIEAVDLPHAMRFSTGARVAPPGTLAEVEKCHILKVLAAHGGNKSRAARTLGIDRKTLIEKTKKYGLAHPP